MRYVPALLGPALTGVLLLAYVLLGATRADAAAAVFAAAALASVAAAALPDAHLHTAGVSLRWLRAGALVVAAVLPGLLPLPRGIVAIVAPGRVAAQPHAGWISLARDPEAVLVEAAGLVAVVGFGAAVAAWGASSYRRGRTEQAIVTLTGLFAVSALMHAASGAPTFLGVLRPSFVPVPFFAPLVNGSHAAAVMLLGGPVAVGLALERREEPWRRLAAGIVAVLACAVIVWSGSLGALLVAVGAAGAAMLVWRRASRAVPSRGVALGVSVACASVLWVAWRGGSVAVRVDLWRDTLAVFGEHWLVGAGGGTYEGAVRAYRSDVAFLTYAHAHNDPLEWIAETGAVGLLGLALAGRRLRPRLARQHRRGFGLAFGLAALATYTLIDFPLQIPAVALSFAAVGACLLSVYGEQERTEARPVRRALLLLGCLQLLGAGLVARAALAEHAASRVLAAQERPADALASLRTLGWLRARADARLLHEAWSAEARADRAAAAAVALQVEQRFPDDPDALRRAAAVLLRTDRTEDALRVLARVTERDPSDFRAWITRARVAHDPSALRASAERWAEALRHGAPADAVAEAHRAVPIGVFWVQALASVDARYSAALAQVLTREGDDAAALLAIEQAAALDPDGYQRDALRGVLLSKLGRAEDARAWMEQSVLPHAPDDPEVLGRYAGILTALGRHHEASDTYLRAARRSVTMRASAIRAAERADGVEAALTLARRLALDGANDPDAELETARLLLATGDARACVNLIDRRGLQDTTVAARARGLRQQCARGGGSSQLP